MPNIFDLDGKVVVITGGAGLIGSEFTRSVSMFNGKAVIADIDIERGRSLQAAVPKSVFHKLDISDETSVTRLIEKLHSEFGRIDALVNSAYPVIRNPGRTFSEVKYDDFCDNVSGHLGGYFLTSQKFSEYFVGQGKGNIVNIASIYGVVAPDFDVYEGTDMVSSVEYVVVKSGLIHLTKFMAKYLRNKNIRVNSISSGGIFDNQPEPFLTNYRNKCLNKGMLDKKDLSGTLIYLLSDSSSALNGQNIIVDDGFTL